MKQLINVYCDESCHLEHDRQKVMLLGCIWAPKEQVPRLSAELRDIKRRHSAQGELKWTKVSQSRIGFFLEIVEWFFSEEPLHFRALVVPDKSVLNHAQFNDGSHDTFYYKMYFSLLSKILSPTHRYNIYVDIKDTRSIDKVNKLHEILCHDRYDFTRQMVEKVQHVRSHEVELLQLADLLLGAMSYQHRDLGANHAKTEVIKKIQRHGVDLLASTPLSETKFNIFIWWAQQVST